MPSAVWFVEHSLQSANRLDSACIAAPHGRAFAKLRPASRGFARCGGHVLADQVTEMRRTRALLRTRKLIELLRDLCRNISGQPSALSSPGARRHGIPSLGKVE